MSTIIAGLFDTRARADEALERLHRAGVGNFEISVFALNAPGQHAQHPIGGDRDESPGAEHADEGATKGVAIGGAVGLAAGAAAVPFVGPIAIPIVAGAGAYVGSLVGALNEMGDGPKREEEFVRSAGTMVAVNASASDVAAETIARTLKESGAVEVERAAGEWNGGTWSDFDPLRAPQRIDVPPPVPSSTASASRAR